MSLYQFAGEYVVAKTSEDCMSLYAEHHTMDEPQLQAEVDIYGLPQVIDPGHALPVRFYDFFDLPLWYIASCRSYCPGMALWITAGELVLNCDAGVIIDEDGFFCAEEK